MVLRMTAATPHSARKPSEMPPRHTSGHLASPRPPALRRWNKLSRVVPPEEARGESCERATQRAHHLGDISGFAPAEYMVPVTDPTNFCGVHCFALRTRSDEHPIARGGPRAPSMEGVHSHDASLSGRHGRSRPQMPRAAPSLSCRCPARNRGVRRFASEPLRVISPMGRTLSHPSVWVQ
jgi:hypothetical protein